VIAVNWGTLVNKGMELIEAHLLFGVGFDRIDVVVHRQSVVHSMVEFADGATIAMASPPDMHLPIALALGWPDRVPGAAAAVDWSRPGTWTFEPLDDDAFPAVRLAKAAGRAGGCRPAIYNAPHEGLVEAFVAGRVAFVSIVDTLARVLDEAPDLPGPGTVDDVLAAQAWARTRARELIAAGGSVTTG